MQPEDQQINQTQPEVSIPVQPVPEEQVNPVSDANVPSKPKNKLKSLTPKLVKILLVMFILIGALFFINLFAPKAIQILKDNNPLASPTPEPTPTSTPVTNFPPSKYANDPEVLQIEEQLKKLESGLNSIEFGDNTLHPPLLEWEIQFEK